MSFFKPVPDGVLPIVEAPGLTTIFGDYEEICESRMARGLPRPRIGTTKIGWAIYDPPTRAMRHLVRDRRADHAQAIAHRFGAGR